MIELAQELFVIGIKVVTTSSCKERVLHFSDRQ
jgi:hypothetical protein